MRILKSELEKIVMEEVIKELHSNPKTRDLITELDIMSLFRRGKKGDAAEDEGEEETDYRDAFESMLDDTGRQLLQDIDDEIQEARKILNVNAYDNAVEKAIINALGGAKNQNEAIVESPAVRPSMLSRKLAAFVSATIQISVMGTSISWLPMSWICTPASTIKKATTNCMPNRSRHDKSKRSSSAPTTASIAAPTTIARKVTKLSGGLKISSAVLSAKKMAKPPIIGL